MNLAEQIIKNSPQLAYLFQMQEPNYRYFQEGNRRFCWTTEKIEHEGKMKFIAFIRKELISKRRKNSKMFKVVKKAYFSKRKTAKAHAINWYNNYHKLKSN